MDRSELSKLGLAPTPSENIVSHVQANHNAILTLTAQNDTGLLVAGTRFGQVATWSLDDAVNVEGHFLPNRFEETSASGFHSSSSYGSHSYMCARDSVHVVHGGDMAVDTDTIPLPATTTSSVPMAEAQLLLGSAAGLVYLLDVQSKACSPISHKTGPPVQRVAYDSLHARIVTLTAKGRVSLLDPKSGQETASLPMSRTGVDGASLLACSQDGRWLAAQSKEGGVDIWSLDRLGKEPGQHFTALDKHHPPLYGQWIHGSLICGGNASTVDVMALDGGVRQVPQPLPSTYCIAQYHDKLTAVGGEGSDICLSYGATPNYFVGNRLKLK
eukprot:TRINITY_DN6337_c0_g1_i1.p1 TRINITY_DN6337_c0_g1~~TRINITY_DN6337_c0_g1_i1.p1  ORF type:complete len:343 (+),score=47.22 TRINITY_DN6337_c0_g1_i1:48-1031(+)